MKRKQFTFYFSYFDVISCIEVPEERDEAYKVLCQYAFFGKKPDFDNMSRGAKMAAKAFMPSLDAARRKAEGGMKSSTKGQTRKKKATSDLQDSNKIATRYEEDSNKIETRYEEDADNKNKNKDKIKTKIKSKLKHESEGAFGLFWEMYPRKVGEAAARAEFLNVDVSLDVLLLALQRQKNSQRWQEDGGRFVPYPANWLKNKLWEDPVDDPGRQPPKGCGPMTESEFGDIVKQME